MSDEGDHQPVEKPRSAERPRRKKRKRASGKRAASRSENGAANTERAPVVAAAGPERRHQRRVTFGATLAVLGLSLVGSGESNVGIAATSVGVLALILAIHRYGRLGPE